MKRKPQALRVVLHDGVELGANSEIPSCLSATYRGLCNSQLSCEVHVLAEKKRCAGDERCSRGEGHRNEKYHPQTLQLTQSLVRSDSRPRQLEGH